MVDKKHHVVLRGDTWANVKEGTEKASSVHKTQSEAEQPAKKQLAREGGGEVRIHRPDGKIKERSRARVSSRKSQARPLQRVIKAVIYQDEDGFYVAECAAVPVATQGKGIEETMRNLQEAVSLYIEGEDLKALGLAPNPSIIVTIELEPAVA